MIDHPIPSPSPVASAGRHLRIERIDALRGFALFGILQVNIQGFAWGAGDPLGYWIQPGTQPGLHSGPQLGLEPAALHSATYSVTYSATYSAALQTIHHAVTPPVGAIDIVLRFLQAAFFEGKFYPIFAFLFGVGLAMQTRKLRHLAHGDAPVARRALRRRLWILLAMGVAHGYLLYCGDVLSAYAVCGLLFLWAFDFAGPVSPQRLRAWSVACGIGAAATIVLPLAMAVFLPDASPPGTVSLGTVPPDLLQAHAVYVHGGLLAQLAQRRDDEIAQQLGSIPTFWPQLFAFLALGMLAGRAGWLHHPQRYPRIWAAARRIGLVFGLPCAILGGVGNVVHALHAPGREGGWDAALLGASSLLAAAYVAGLLAWFATGRGRRISRWLAYAGRMSLTNYVGQSLAMNLLLSAWGLGLGARANAAELAALAAAIFAVQLVCSRWILARYRQGPLEAMWRAGTYAGLR